MDARRVEFGMTMRKFLVAAVPACALMLAGCAGEVSMETIEPSGVSGVR